MAELPPPTGAVPGAARTSRLATLPALLVPFAVLFVARRAGHVAYRLVRAAADEARQGPARWWLAGGPEPIARLAQQFVGGLALVALVLVVVRADRRPLGRALGLAPGPRDALAWPLLAIGSLAFWLVVALGLALVARLTGTSSESGAVTHVFALIRGAPAWLALSMITVIALGAGIGEELLLRGWLQRRLLERWPPAQAIALSALVFALVHGEPFRIAYAFPLGLWLGYVAYRAGSVLPAVLCHVVMDAVPLALGRVHVDFEPATATAALWGALACALALTLAAAAAGVARLERAARRASGPTGGDPDAGPAPPA